MPKALVPLAGRPLVCWSVEALHAGGVTDVLVAVPPAERASFAAVLPGDVQLVDGGATRTASVRAALARVSGGAEAVLVHDAARPLTPPQVVARVLARSGLRAAGAPRTAWAALAMGQAGSPLVPRVRALLAPAPRQRPGLVLATAALLALVAVGVGSAVHAQEDTESVFEQAMTAPAHAGTALHDRTPHHR